MSYISRSGNLAKTPELRQGERRNFTYARVIVTDRIKEGDKFVDGPSVTYDVLVNGKDAETLVDTARRNGNIRLMFSGRYRVTEYEGRDGKTYVKHEVQADEIGVSLRNRPITVAPRQQRETPAQPEVAGPAPTGWPEVNPALRSPGSSGPGF